MLTRSQIRQVFRTARSRARHAERAEVAFALSVGLGLRAKEIASLKWRDVVDERGALRQVLHLKASYTKGAKTRDVFLSSPSVKRVLSDYVERRWLPNPALQQRALLRSQKGGHLTSGSVVRLLKELYRDAGIPNASSHSGRRTLITGLAERGIDLKSISIIAGHASVKTTAVYVESSPVRLAKILGEVSW